MFATLVTVTLFAAAAFNGVAAQSDLTIDTPQEVTTCEPVTFNWTGGSGPFDLIAVSPSDPCGTPVVDFGALNNNSLTWIPNLPAGTQLELSLEDANENVAWSGTFTIAQGSDTSCISGAASSSSAASSAAASSSVAVTGTTMVITGSAPTQPASASSSAPAGPLGAVGNNGPLEASSNGAMTHATAPIMLLSAIAGLLAFSL
jgi:hypothetical protein